MAATPACARRLARDLREVQSNPLPTIAAEPRADDIRIWHVSFTAADGPYVGVPFHLVMNFPERYPAAPPRVQLCTMIPHPNVFEGYDYNAHRAEAGVWLCLNMLRDASQGSYSGWSGAYSVFSILVQLQSFLFAENVPQDWGGSSSSEGYCAKAADAAYEFHRAKGHLFPAIDAARAEGLQAGHLWGGESTRPAADLLLSDLIESQLVASGTTKPSQPGDAGDFDFGGLPDDVLVKIADMMPPQAVSALFRTCKGAAATLGRAQLSVRRELVCFYSKVPFTEAVLGFGMDVQHGARYENGTRHVKGITTELELLSRDSFSSGVRCGVWRTAGKAEDFNQWLPVLLDADHTARAMPLVRAGLMAIAGHPPQRPFDPLVALTVLPKLLNQMTVRLMTCDDNTSLHASEKALLGFTSFHHMLLKLASEHPIIQTRAEHWVSEFARSPARRNKLVIHDLGEFLVLLYLCPEGKWEELAAAFIEESFVRNVRWVLDPREGDCGDLAVLEADDEACEYRLRRTLHASATSKRLLMFQAFFLRHVAKPAGQSPTDILARLERGHGRPPAGTAAKLQGACREILGPLSWEKFFVAMGVPLPDKLGLSRKLRAAVRRSEERGYHLTDNVDWPRLRKTRARRDKAFKTAGSTTSDADSNSSGGSAVWSSASSGVEHKLFVAGLLGHSTEQQLRTLVCSFGQPTAVAKQPNARHAYIWFRTEEEASAVLQYLKEVSVRGRPLRVERAKRASGGAGLRRTAPGSTPAELTCPFPPTSLEASRWYKANGRVKTRNQ